MSKRKVMSIICIPLMLLFIVCLFIPFVSNGDFSYSFWKLMDLQEQMQVNIIVIILTIIALIIFILQLCGVLKDAKFAYFSLGYLLTNYINVFITLMDKENASKYLSFGFWLGIILLISVLVLLIISGFLSNGNDDNSEIIGYDPKTGKPIYDSPKKITGYDPYTGEAIYK